MVGTAATHKQIRSAVLSNPHSMATTLSAALLDMYGTEYFDWEPASLSLQLHEDADVLLPKVNRDKIWATVTLLTTDHLYRALEGFHAIMTAFNDETVDFSSFVTIDSDELAWGMTEAVLLLGEDYDVEAFSPEVASYCGIILRQDGIYRPPALLRFADMVSINVHEFDDQMMLARESRQQRALQDLESYVRARLSVLRQQLMNAGLTSVSADGLRQMTDRIGRLVR